MKRIVGVALFIGLLGLLGACNKEEEELITEAPEIFQLAAEFTAPEMADVGETVALKTIVTQGEEKVDEADEVVYEVWEEGEKATSKMIESVNEGNGVYTAETSFDHDGLFHIQVHVTANAQHTMPLVEVTIGDGGQYEEVVHVYETEGFLMHFMNPEMIMTGEETEFVVHIELNEEALEQAKVRYEIWDEHSEAAPGEYSAKHTFEKAGSYMIQVHVENDDGLHEIEEHEIKVM